jgi:hypothetical protein
VNFMSLEHSFRLTDPTTAAFTTTTTALKEARAVIFKTKQNTVKIMLFVTCCVITYMYICLYLPLTIVSYNEA